MIRCYVTDRRHGDVLASARRAVRDGVDFIQVREKDLPARECLELVSRVCAIAKGLSTRVLVNDRLDVALAAHADGVHLPANGIPPFRVRRLVSVLGVSTHSLEEAVAAERDRADFIVFGPIFDTPGKQPVGLNALREITSAVRIPVLGIGGITTDNTNLVIDAAAAGIAAIRMFQQ